MGYPLPVRYISTCFQSDLYFNCLLNMFRSSLPHDISLCFNIQVVFAGWIVPLTPYLQMRPTYLVRCGSLCRRILGSLFRFFAGKSGCLATPHRWRAHLKRDNQVCEHNIGWNPRLLASREFFRESFKMSWESFEKWRKFQCREKAGGDEGGLKDREPTHPISELSIGSIIVLALLGLSLIACGILCTLKRCGPPAQVRLITLWWYSYKTERNGHQLHLATRFGGPFVCSLIQCEKTPIDKHSHLYIVCKFLELCFRTTLSQENDSRNQIKSSRVLPSLTTQTAPSKP